MSALNKFLEAELRSMALGWPARRKEAHELLHNYIGVEGSMSYQNVYHALSDKDADKACQLFFANRRP